VSMPYEQAVIPFLDELDEAARVIGAVNTINNLDGILTGYNTDYLGAVRALEERNKSEGKVRGNSRCRWCGSCHCLWLVRIHNSFDHPIVQELTGGSWGA